MITCILSTTSTVEPPAFTFFSIVWLIAILAYGAIFALIIIGLIRLVRFLGSAGKEMKLTRMEVGKLAEEVYLMRQELKGGEKGNPPTKSG